MEYDLSRGPVFNSNERGTKTLSRRAMHGPADLMRSLRYGISRELCVECGEFRNNLHEGTTRHSNKCSMPGKWWRVVTPLGAKHETYLPDNDELEPPT